MQRLIESRPRLRRRAATSTSTSGRSPTTGPSPASGSTTSCRARPRPSRKRDPRDFALWKAAKPGEPAWSTPWGPGRPGWHLECSAMATFYLGPRVRHPRRRPRPASSRTTRTSGRSRNAVGDGFARFWLHNAWVTLGGEKMSKSLGNTLSIDALLRRVRGVELRYYLVAPHYRSMIEYSDAALDEAVAAFRRIESFVHRVRGAGRPARAGVDGAAGVRRRPGRRPGHAGRARGRPRRRPRGQHRARRGRPRRGGEPRVGRPRDDRRARPRPAGPPLGHRRERTRPPRPHSTRSSATCSRSGRRRGPAATSPLRTPCATGSPPRASPSRTHPTAPPGH